MPHFEALVRKLRHTTNLDDDDIKSIRDLPMTVRDVPANQTVVREGDRP
jgi:hypothetical protein